MSMMLTISKINLALIGNQELTREEVWHQLGEALQMTVLGKIGMVVFLKSKETAASG
jgi:hypothetical protein